jgi:NAD(P)-dependent dehydrogenase (short-subunit alcohol dehydrogenase family)
MTKHTILDKFRLDKQVAIVTGGVGLLGNQFCRALAEAGASVVVADINPTAIEKTTSLLKKDDLDVFGVTVDVTRPESVNNLVDKTLEQFGRLDILVCSAAIDPKFDPSHKGKNANSFEDYPLDSWQQALDVNLTGLFLCAQAAVKPMVKQQHGVIINICSTYGLVGPDQRIYEKPGQTAKAFKPVFYSVTKAGVLGLTHYLATYYAGTNIRANALTPGGVYNGHDDNFVKNYSSRTVLGRMARQDEMNGALLFLASDASSYMTGANLIVDGGWTAW